LIAAKLNCSYAHEAQVHASTLPFHRLAAEEGEGVAAQWPIHPLK
jgi:hypothetical protein